MRTQADPRPDAGPAVEALISQEGLSHVLNASRRTVERMRAAGKLPKPDLHVGKMPRWKPDTVRAWIETQARGN